MALCPREGREGTGRGIPPGVCYHARLVGSDPGGGPDGLRLFDPSPLPWLHMRWAGCVLAKSSGSPPLDTGTISSTSKLMGWPGGSE